MWGGQGRLVDALLSFAGRLVFSLFIIFTNTVGSNLDSLTKLFSH